MRALINAYYLQEEAARALRRGEPPAVLDEVFEKTRHIGAQLVRTNAYNNDPAKWGDSALRRGEQRDSLAWVALDHVVTRAAAHGLQLVLVLGNQWRDMGGPRELLAAAGIRDAREGDRRLFDDAAVRAQWKREAREVLDRVNTIDGIRYAEHPAVAAWELLNEPRGVGLDAAGHAMRHWVDDLAREVRRSTRALVSTGEEGLDVGFAGRDAAFWKSVGASWLFRATTSFRLNSASPFVDVASVHVYPEDWGVPHAHVAEAGERFLREGARLAARHRKPLLVGEMGLRRGARSLEERRAILRRWMDVAREEGAWAAGLWMLAHDTRPDAWDAYQFKVDCTRSLSDAVNDVACVLG